MVEQCGDCRFWRKRTDHAEEMGGGYCRRFPPFFPSALRVMRPMHERDFADIESSGGFLNDAWPMVHQQSWCGEWRRATHPAEDGR